MVKLIIGASILRITSINNSPKSGISGSFKSENLNENFSSIRFFTSVKSGNLRPVNFSAPADNLSPIVTYALAISPTFGTLKFFTFSERLAKPVFTSSSVGIFNSFILVTKFSNLVFISAVVGIFISGNSNPVSSVNLSDTLVIELLMELIAPSIFLVIFSLVSSVWTAVLKFENDSVVEVQSLLTDSDDLLRAFVNPSLTFVIAPEIPSWLTRPKVNPLSVPATPSLIILNFVAPSFFASSSPAVTPSNRPKSAVTATPTPGINFAALSTFAPLAAFANVPAPFWPGPTTNLPALFLVNFLPCLSIGAPPNWDDAIFNPLENAPTPFIKPLTPNLRTFKDFKGFSNAVTAARPKINELESPVNSSVKFLRLGSTKNAIRSFTNSVNTLLNVSNPLANAGIIFSFRSFHVSLWRNVTKPPSTATVPKVPSIPFTPPPGIRLPILSPKPPKDLPTKEFWPKNFSNLLDCNSFSSLAISSLAALEVAPCFLRASSAFLIRTSSSLYFWLSLASIPVSLRSSANFSNCSLSVFSCIAAVDLASMFDWANESASFWKFLVCSE